MESNKRTQTGYLGPLHYVDSYLITRHPLPILATLNPFGSLEAKFWINYTILYIIFLLTSIYIHLKVIITNRTTLTQLSVIIHFLISPSALRCFNATNITGLLFKSLFSFSFWTFEVLFGVDLWEALVGQTFEDEVNTWHDITYLETQFVFDPTIIDYSLIGFGLLEREFIFTRKIRGVAAIGDSPFMGESEENIVDINIPRVNLPA